MSLAQIENAVCQLTSQAITDLAEFIEQRDKAAWDRQMPAELIEGRIHRPQDFPRCRRDCLAR